jgi:hypothetical protein
LTELIKNGAITKMVWFRFSERRKLRPKSRQINPLSPNHTKQPNFNFNLLQLGKFFFLNRITIIKLQFFPDCQLIVVDPSKGNRKRSELYNSLW